MPALLTDYTPLESLLVFQSLERFGIDHDAFQKISTLLQSNKFVQDGLEGSSARLSPDALRKLVDSLVEDESRSDGGRQIISSTNGIEEDGSPGSVAARKRKLPVGSSTPVEDLLKSPHSLSQLVRRLYSRYRQNAIHQIRNDEHKFFELQKEIKDLEISSQREEGSIQPKGHHEEGGRASGATPRTSADRSINSPSIQPHAITGRSLTPNPYANTALPPHSSPSLQPGPAQRDTSDGRARSKSPQKTSKSVQDRLFARGDRSQLSLHDFQRARADGTAKLLAVGAGESINPVTPGLGQTLNAAQSGVAAQQLRLEQTANSQTRPSTQHFPNSTITPSIGRSNEPRKFNPGELSQVAVPGQKGLTPHSLHNQPSPGINDGRDFARARGRNSPLPQTYTSPYQPNPQAAAARQNQHAFGDQPVRPLPPHVRSDVRPASQSRHESASPVTPGGTTSFINRSLPQLQTISMSASSTRWKDSPYPNSGRGSPDPGEVSPLSDHPLSPTPSSRSATRQQRNSKALTASSPADVLKRSANKTEPKRERMTRNQKGRSASISSAAGRTSRSRSATSHLEDPAIKHVKREEPATPRFSVEDLEIRTSNRYASDDTGSISKPRGIVRETSVSDIPGFNFVFTTKNFSRTTAPILNIISGHRLASVFANPVKERDAPGYKDIIYRPQDLKSIKSAITAGSRAVAAHQSSVGTPREALESPGGASAAATTSSSKNAGLWLPRSADIIPPKGIVNASQLEKELMRMFANAVMFNPDPRRGFGPAFNTRKQANAGADEDDDGNAGGGASSHYAERDGEFVMDAREMFEAVELSLGNWRSVEGRGSGRADRSLVETEHGEDEGGEDGSRAGDQGGGSLLEDGQGTAKRRRRA